MISSRANLFFSLTICCAVFFCMVSCELTSRHTWGRVSNENRLPGWLGERHREYSAKIANRSQGSSQTFKLHAERVPHPATISEDLKRTEKKEEHDENEIVQEVEKQGETSAPSIKACFLTLTRGNSKGMATLMRLIKNVDETFRHAPDYPMVIFHEGVTAMNQHKLQLTTRRPLEFAEVVFDIPEFITDPPERWRYPGHSWYGVGYRHMCRFFAVEMFKQPVLQKYDWYMRLDTDSYLLSTYHGDPFKQMVRRGKKYAFTTLFMQGEFIFMRDLWDTVKKFLVSEHVEPSSTMEAFYNERGQYSGLHFWDNFEIGYLPFWRSEIVQRFLDHIDKSGGIYFNRWGDAELHTLTVALFLPGESIWYADIPYQHYFYYHCPKMPLVTHQECIHNATHTVTSSEIKKEAGRVPMEPAEHAHHNTAFLKIAKEKWHWSSKDLEGRRRR